MPSTRGLSLGLALTLSLPEPAEAISLPLDGRVDTAPREALDLKRASPRQEVPPWLDWALKVANGSLFSLPQPTWEGPLATAGSLWRLELDLGYKKRPDLGVGPTVGLLGRLRWLPWVAEAQVSVLGTQGGLGASGELILSAAPMQLRLRSWTCPGASSAGLSVSLKLTQRF
ncbi:MAG TPA: hypothetical protein V6D00_03525 [Pantanalinema sp.]